jgi:hypothetical protein
VFDMSVGLSRLWLRGGAMHAAGETREGGDARYTNDPRHI